MGGGVEDGSPARSVVAMASIVRACTEPRQRNPGEALQHRFNPSRSSGVGAAIAGYTARDVGQEGPPLAGGPSDVGVGRPASPSGLHASTSHQSPEDQLLDNSWRGSLE